jgi:hypothetical protein
MMERFQTGLREVSLADANAKKVLYFLGAPFDVAQDMLYAFARVTFSFLSILVAA